MREYNKMHKIKNTLFFISIVVYKEAKINSNYVIQTNIILQYIDSIYHVRVI